MESNNNNKFGLSKKTNIALAAIGGITAVNERWEAIVGIAVIAIYSITMQYILDTKFKRSRDV